MKTIKKTMFEIANQAFREKRYDEAIIIYKNIINYQPDFYQYYVNLGQALEHAGHAHEAIDVYRRVLEFKGGKSLVSHSIKRLQDKIITARSNTSVLPCSQSQTEDDSNLLREDPFILLRRFKPRNEEALKANYIASGLDLREDNFILYRIIGNDLFPRHKKGQSRENLHFILRHESPLINCEKRWIVNRIVDPVEEQKIIDLLKKHKQTFIHIPFEPDEYCLVKLDTNVLPFSEYLESEAYQNLPERKKNSIRTALYRLKNNYLMNNNGARNAALCDGRGRAKWVLPWDGNCFVTEKAWQGIIADVTARPHLKYFAVPMERMLDNADLLRVDRVPHPVEEPQLLFRCDSAEEFNEAFPYGRRPKVELFWRLGIPGVWDTWGDDPWDPPRRPISPEAHQFGCAGWVTRLFSGQAEQEGANSESRKNRSQARQDAIIATIEEIDREVRETKECANHKSPKPTSLPSTSIIYANRKDGLGERISAIINAMAISEITGVPFRFTWEQVDDPRHKGGFHSVTPLSEIFSISFINNYLTSESEAKDAKYIKIPKTSMREARNDLLQEINNREVLIPQNPALLNILKSDREACLKFCTHIWSKISFSSPIENIRNSIVNKFDFPNGAIAIHLRAGDIIYGRYSKNPRWLTKVICAPMASILGLKMKEEGKEVIFFGQEYDTSRKLAERLGMRTADELYPFQPQSHLESAFMDIFLMSRCSSIFSGSSGFARVASQIELADLPNPLSVFSYQEWTDRIHAEVSSNPELYSPEQRAYAYLVCIHYCLKSGAIEAIPEYIRLARIHNPTNEMYAIIEAFIPLHFGNTNRSEELLEIYFRDIELESPQKFSRSTPITVINSSVGGENSDMAYANFLPKEIFTANSLQHPYLFSTMRFLNSKCSKDNIECLRSEMLELRAHARSQAMISA